MKGACAVCRMKKLCLGIGKLQRLAWTRFVHLYFAPAIKPLYEHEGRMILVSAEFD